MTTKWEVLEQIEEFKVGDAICRVCFSQTGPTWSKGVMWEVLDAGGRKILDGVRPYVEGCDKEVELSNAKNDCRSALICLISRLVSLRDGLNGVD